MFSAAWLLVLQRYSQTGNRMSSKEATHHLQNRLIAFIASILSFFSFIRSSNKKNSKMFCVCCWWGRPRPIEATSDWLGCSSAFSRLVYASVPQVRRRGALFGVSVGGVRNGNPILPVYTKSSLGIHHSREDWAPITRDLFSTAPGTI